MQGVEFGHPVIRHDVLTHAGSNIYRLSKTFMCDTQNAGAGIAIFTQLYPHNHVPNNKAMALLFSPYGATHKKAPRNIHSGNRAQAYGRNINSN